MTAPPFADSVPWPDEVATLLPREHETKARVIAHLAGGDVDLPATSLDIGWDETRAPRVTASVTIPLPEANLLAQLDPRYRVRVSIVVGYRLDSGTLAERTVATLDLRRATERVPAGVLVLDLAGVEGRVLDHGLAYLVSGASLSVVQQITLALTSIWYPTPPPLVIDTRIRDVSRAFESEYGADPWQQIDQWVDELGADLYDPGNGTLVLTPRPVVAGAAVHQLRSGPGGTVTDYDSTVSRESWFNAVHLRYDNGEEPGLWVYGNADLTGPLAPSQVGYVTFVETREGKPTQAAANAAAAAVLARMQSGGRAYSCSAIAAWFLRTGHPVSVETARDAQERHLVSSVRFAYPDDSMTLTTRRPEV